MMNASPQPDVPILVETPSRPVIPMVLCHYWDYIRRANSFNLHFSARKLAGHASVRRRTSSIRRRKEFC